MGARESEGEWIRTLADVFLEGAQRFSGDPKKAEGAWAGAERNYPSGEPKEKEAKKEKEGPVREPLGR